MQYFPVEINSATLEELLRVPGIGVKSAGLIVAARRHGRVTSETLKRMGVVMKKAQYFMTCGEISAGSGIASSQVIGDVHPDLVRKVLTQKKPSRKGAHPDQTVLVFPE